MHLFRSFPTFLFRDQEDTLVLDDDNSRVFNFADIETEDAPAVSIEAEDVTFVNVGDISAENDDEDDDDDEGGEFLAIGIDVGGTESDPASARIVNFGEISGDDFGISFSEDASGTVRNTKFGTISSSNVAIDIDGDGVLILNDGTIEGGVAAIDATDAGDVEIDNTGGTIIGDVLLGDGDDTFVGGQGGTVDGIIDTGAGDDTVTAGAGDNQVFGGSGEDRLSGNSGDDTLTGGLGDDELIGSGGVDTADYSDIDVPVTVMIGGDGDGTATRETGFSISHANVVVDQDNLLMNAMLNPNLSGDFVTEAVAGNLYYNIHTTDFGAGEIRGQLLLASDTMVDDVRTIVLEAELDADQEPGPDASDSEATGTGTVIITVDGDVVTYSSDLTVTGLAQSDLMPVAGFSAIHLHNAPAGQDPAVNNGPVVLDIVQDAGGDINGDALSLDADTGDGDVFDETIETDTLISIENVTASNDGDIIISSGALSNVIMGLDGDDFIAGGGGTDMLDGGAGNDTNSFSTIGVGVVADLANGQAAYQPAPGVTVNEIFANFENLDGSAFDDNLFGDGGTNVLTGNDGNDVLQGRGGSDTIEGGDGDDEILGGGGSDVTDGGEGIDTVSFADIQAGVTASLAGETAQYEAPSGAIIVDEVLNFENITGSAFDDNLTGDAGDNLIAGGAGEDTLNGGAGNDILRGDAVGDGEAVTVAINNLLPLGGTFVTPLWFGFHDGNLGTDPTGASSFDFWTEGEAASLGLERIAEDGTVETISAEFNQQTGDGGVDATLIGPAGVPGPIDPLETATFTINVNPDEVGQGFFSWGVMVIPSNDAFLAVPDDPLADPIFDADGTFIGDQLVIVRTGADVIDAGTEFNTELDAAFLNQMAPDTGLDENGVALFHPGFNGSAGNPDGILGNPDGMPGEQLILGGITAPGLPIDDVIGDFTLDDDALLTISIGLLEGSDDVLNGGAGDDTLGGGGGNDALSGGADNDLLDGGDGNDDLRGNAGDDELLGGAGNDELLGGGGIDDLRGGSGEDDLRGGQGDDELRGNSDDDELRGNAGNDLLLGGGGIDDLRGGSGEDDLRGGQGDDELRGNSDDDELRGNAGNDLLLGGSGDDLLLGGADNDTLDGGAGNDTLDGGGGADVFIFVQGEDTILDFGDGLDLIDISGTGLDAAAAVAASVVIDGDTVIDFGENDILTLNNFVGLNENDFL